MSGPGSGAPSGLAAGSSSASGSDSLVGAPPAKPAALGALATAGVVAGALVVSAAVATGAKHGPVGPWTVGIVILALAGAVGSGRLWLPANPLARHLLVAVVGAVFLLLFSDHVSAFGNYEIAQVAYLVPAVAGLNLLTGWNGQLSLGHGALMAVGAYTAAELMVHQPHIPIIVLLAAAVIVTSLAGVVVGLAAARLRGPYLAGATLTFALAVPEIATHYATIFGADQGEPVRPLGVPSWLSSTFPAEKWLAWVAIGCALVTLVLIANLMHSGIGRRWRCVRDDEIAAAVSGINVSVAQVRAFIVSSACAGLAGGLYGLWAGNVDPGAFGLTLSFTLLTAIVIGGVGSLAGSVWGAIALVFVPKYTDSASKHFHFATTTRNNLPLAIYGVVLVVAMLAFPEGIQGAIRRIGGMIPARLPRRTRPGEDLTPIVSDAAAPGAPGGGA